MSYELTWEQRGVVKRFFGSVTNDELMQSVIETERDARFDDIRYVINDFLACTECLIETRTVDEVAAIDSVAALTNSRIHIAIVTNLPEIVAAAKQYAESPINVYTTRIFATLKDARTWLEGQDLLKIANRRCR